MDIKCEGPEWAAVKGWWDRDNSVHSRQSREEENKEQHGHVEVIGSRGFEDPLVRDIAAHHSPALQIHRGVETEHIDSWQAWSIKRTHPRNKEESAL